MRYDNARYRGKRKSIKRQMIDLRMAHLARFEPARKRAFLRSEFASIRESCAIRPMEVFRGIYKDKVVCPNRHSLDKRPGQIIDLMAEIFHRYTHTA